MITPKSLRSPKIAVPPSKAKAKRWTICATAKTLSWALATSARGDWPNHVKKGSKSINEHYSIPSNAVISFRQPAAQCIRRGSCLWQSNQS